MATLSHMGLLCARLSCRFEAAASLQFNTDESQVIIIDLTEPTGGIPLCQDHVRTRTAPMGWTLVDHRLAMPPRRHLESVPQPDLSMTITAPRRPRPEDTANHPAAGDVAETVASDVVPPTVVGPSERPSQRRPMDRGFPWEWAAEDDSDEGADASAEDADEPSDDTSPNESGVDTSSKPSTPLLSRAFRNNPIDPDEAS